MKFPLKLKDREKNICRLTHPLSSHLKDADPRPDSPLNPQETEPIGRERLRTGMSQFSVAMLRTRAGGKDFLEAEYLNGF